MTKEELAKKLNGREYRNEITDSEAKEAKNSGLVIVFGASDDLLELRGSIEDEFGCYDGGEALIDSDGLLPDRENIDEDDELEEYFSRKKTAKKIEAIWNKGNISWQYKTSIPHSIFKVMEDGEVYCKGIVFSINEIDKASKAPKRDRDKAKRPSPSDSATLYEEGFEMKGNDGNMYKVAIASNGVKRWQKKK